MICIGFHAIQPDLSDIAIRWDFNLWAPIYRPPPTPAFVLIFGALLLRERVTWRSLIALLVASLGVLAVNRKLVETTATMLAGMAHHLATGETVEPGFKAA